MSGHDGKDKVIDIKTRRGEARSPSHWFMVEQLIAAEGVIEIVRIMADICSGVPEINPLPAVPPKEEINDRVAEILRNAAAEIECVEDTAKVDDHG